ncbi:MAG: hypothetical protein ABSG53_10790 [Thermoguttaceae bacterium]
MEGGPLTLDEAERCRADKIKGLKTHTENHHRQKTAELHAFLAGTFSTLESIIQFGPDTTKARCNWQTWWLGEEKAPRPEKPDLDTQGLYQFVKEAAAVVVRRVGGRAGKIADIDDAPGNCYYVETQINEVTMALAALDPESLGLDSKTTHQRCVSQPELHTLLQEKLLQQTIERLTDPTAAARIESET